MISDKISGGVRSLTPSRELVNLAGTIFRNLWERCTKESKKRRAALKLEAAGLDKKIGQFLGRIIDADNATTIRACERKIDELER